MHLGRTRAVASSQQPKILEVVRLNFLLFSHLRVPGSLGYLVQRETRSVNQHQSGEYGKARSSI
jgi:hypothetical protein